MRIADFFANRPIILFTYWRATNCKILSLVLASGHYFYFVDFSFDFVPETDKVLNAVKTPAAIVNTKITEFQR